MTNIFTRMKDSIEADLHDMFDKKEENNPIKALNQYLRQAEQEKEKVGKLIERQYRLKEEFQREYFKSEELAAKRLKQAKIAEKAGETEMHQFAVKEYEEYEQRTERMKKAQQEANEQLIELEQKYEEMKHKLKDMHLRRMELMGRENIAKANHQMSKVMEERADKPLSKFADMERYIEGLEHKVNNSYYRTTFDSKMANLEKEMQEKELVDKQ